MTGKTTKRFGGSTADITAGTTKRILLSGAVTLLGGDTWGKSWGGFISLAPAADRAKCWGSTWSLLAFLSLAAPILKATKRIVKAGAVAVIKRVTEVPEST